MSDKCFDLVALLADGQFHSGEKIGAAMGMSRAAVWKLVQSLASLGLDVHAVSGRGYRLAQPLELLTEESIRQQLSEHSSALLTRLEIHQVLESSNSYLMQQAMGGSPSGVACFTEYQQAGRGRRGREWLSPYGSNIYLSLLWRFQDGASRLGGLSLAVAVAVMQSLESLGLDSGGLKWPNDIIVKGKKLAGILVDVAGESNGPCHAVIGIGINFDMPEKLGETISQPWTDLRHCGIKASRNEVAGKLLHELLLTIPKYQADGLERFRSAWQRWDLSAGKTVRISHGDESHYGVARGIDERGLLLLQDETGIHRYASGEVSLRAVDE
jgi:BirA family biotin operon repressor/biotin-[acetyl-CoA-carboxylase] ligase